MKMRLDSHQNRATIPSMSNVFEQLRRAVERNPKTWSQLSREAGLEPAAMCRFVHRKTGLTVESVEKLARALRLELTLRPKGRKGR